MEMTVEMKPKKSIAEEMADLFHEFPNPKDTVTTAELAKPWNYQIWDLSQKYLSLSNNTLVAAPKGSNSPEEVLAVVPNRGFENSSSTIFPIFMGLQDGNRVLSCIETGAQPQISIMEEGIMKLYKNVQPFKNFTFLNHPEDSQQTCSFESAAFPGWFLSTSTEPNKPIGLSRKGGAEIATFYFIKK
uniref:Interleukin-1 n=1 Tax=Anolis carolinensis TaxID=28377 RepID=H9G558_ANOCA|nr:PREDICTED: interleukin-36 receptor antagonist protein isoform X2 [Anolis carolinensis]XP_016851105.1 PREDICTED: interleukin-36 receptor antagonist protein isoform X2 [Anolis carolinensis]|eukprot:XP_003224252.1 PREDICTED: interleukin-36 receptor antagonist protein isoform X2 [Anolis carolinensis]